jgi:hypothetical protein
MEGMGFLIVVILRCNCQLQVMMRVGIPGFTQTQGMHVAM